MIEKEIFKLDKSDRYIISFGAVGYPRGGGKFMRYGIFDQQKYQLEFIKLEGELLPFGLCIAVPPIMKYSKWAKSETWFLCIYIIHWFHRIVPRETWFLR